MGSAESVCECWVLEGRHWRVDDTVIRFWAVPKSNENRFSKQTLKHSLLQGGSLEQEGLFCIFGGLFAV